MDHKRSRYYEAEHILFRPNEIPPEIWLEIFAHLQFHQRVQSRIVCRMWNSLILSHPPFWNNTDPEVLFRCSRNWKKGDFVKTELQFEAVVEYFGFEIFGLTVITCHEDDLDRDIWIYSPIDLKVLLRLSSRKTLEQIAPELCYKNLKTLRSCIFDDIIALEYDGLQITVVFKIAEIDGQIAATELKVCKMFDMSKEFDSIFHFPHFVVHYWEPSPQCRIWDLLLGDWKFQMELDETIYDRGELHSPYVVFPRKDHILEVHHLSNPKTRISIPVPHLEFAPELNSWIISQQRHQIFVFLETQREIQVFSLCDGAKIHSVPVLAAGFRHFSRTLQRDYLCIGEHTLAEFVAIELIDLDDFSNRRLIRLPCSYCSASVPFISPEMNLVIAMRDTSHKSKKVSVISLVKLASVAEWQMEIADTTVQYCFSTRQLVAQKHEKMLHVYDFGSSVRSNVSIASQ